jgi:hypothetical protein
MHISEKLGQKYIVITVDQALYFKLMDLKWSVPRYKDSVFPRLGGLHIARNFMKCIGDQGLESMAYIQQLLNQDHTCLNVDIPYHF